MPASLPSVDDSFAIRVSGSGWAVARRCCCHTSAFTPLQQRAPSTRVELPAATPCRAAIARSFRRTRPSWCSTVTQARPRAAACRPTHTAAPCHDAAPIGDGRVSVGVSGAVAIASATMRTQSHFTRSSLRAERRRVRRIPYASSRTTRVCSRVQNVGAAATSPRGAARRRHSDQTQYRSPVIALREVDAAHPGSRVKSSPPHSAW